MNPGGEIRSQRVVHQPVPLDAGKALEPLGHHYHCEMALACAGGRAMAGVLLGNR